jgi:hypothetical protein
MPAKFTAQFKPKETRPDEPILIGREFSQARVSINEAEQLVIELRQAITMARLCTPDYSRQIELNL